MGFVSAGLCCNYFQEKSLSTRIGIVLHGFNSNGFNDPIFCVDACLYFKVRSTITVNFALFKGTFRLLF